MHQRMLCHLHYTLDFEETCCFWNSFFSSDSCNLSVAVSSHLLRGGHTQSTETHTLTDTCVARVLPAGTLTGQQVGKQRLCFMRWSCLLGENMLDALCRYGAHPASEESSTVALKIIQAGKHLCSYMEWICLLVLFLISHIVDKI